MDSFKPVIEEIEKRLKSVSDEKLQKALNELIPIFEDLDRRQIPTESIADQLKSLKNILTVEELRLKQVVRLKADLLGVLRRQYGLVTPKYYQTLWMILGMTIFGVPFGMIFSFAIDNMAFLGLGFGFGMPIGMAIGIAKDKKALEDGLVINGVQQTI